MMKRLASTTLFLVSGCVSMMVPNVVQRTGVRYAALPANCPVDFVASTSGFNTADYETLGHLTISGHDSFTDAAKADLRPTVCEWGGTAVTIMASSGGGMSKASTFTIHRKRDASAGPVALACSGRFVNRDGASIVFDGTSTAKMAFAGNEAPCEARGAPGAKVILTCGAGSQDGSFASDCSKVNVGGLDFNKVP